MLAPNNELHELIALMQNQDGCVSQIYKVINLLYTDLHFAQNLEFHNFTEHFNIFWQKHASSEGFCRAIDAMKIYHDELLEQLLDYQVLVAAEELELAIVHLDMVSHAAQVRNHADMMLLNQGITLLEENLLKIIEKLEVLLEDSRQTQLQH